MWPMGTSRVSRSERKAERKRQATDFPQLPPAPDDYPTFPDKSTWPVVFPALPPSPGGGPRRPPQHVSKAAAPRIPATQLPNHVAIVMDGNGRWATQRGLTRVEGHKMGEAVVIDIVCGAIEIGIKWLSLYAFSTENWKRSAEEVRFLMGFNRDVAVESHQEAHFLGGTLPVLGGERVEAEPLDSDFDCAADDVDDHGLAHFVTFDAGQSALGGPAAVAVHHDGDVIGQLVGHNPGCGGLGNVLRRPAGAAVRRR